GYQVLAGMVFEILHRSADGVQVLVHVQRRHKYGHLQAFVFKVFGLVHFFYHYHFAIGRGYYKVVARGMHARGNAEEPQYPKPQQEEDEHDEIVQPGRTATKKPVAGIPYGYPQYRGNDDEDISFAMN